MRQRRLVALPGIAVAGLVAGHALDYLLIAPDPAHRHDLLLHTGHGWLPGGVPIAIGLSIVGVCATALMRGGRDSARSVATWLAGTQAAAFVLLEVGERVIAHAPLRELAGPVLAIGVVVQLLLGALGGLFLSALDRVADGVRPVFTRPAPTGRGSDLVAVVDGTRAGRASAGSLSIRGPPLLSI